jgi:hypothetical protein
MRAGANGKRNAPAPLEPAAAARLLSRVPSERERAEARAEVAAATMGAGAVAAAATAGAFVAFGARAGDPVRHVNALAGLLLDSRVAFVTGPHALVTSVGIVLLVAGTLLWSALFALAAVALGRRRGAGVLLASCTIAILAFCVDALVLPRLAGDAVLADLSLTRLALVHLLLAASFPIGMRLALPDRNSWSDDALDAPRVYRSSDGG